MISFPAVTVVPCQLSVQPVVERLDSGTVAPSLVLWLSVVPSNVQLHWMLAIGWSRVMWPSLSALIVGVPAVPVGDVRIGGTSTPLSTYSALGLVTLNPPVSE